MPAGGSARDPAWPSAARRGRGTPVQHREAAERAEGAGDHIGEAAQLRRRAPARCAASGLPPVAKSSRPMRVCSVRTWIAAPTAAISSTGKGTRPKARDRPIKVGERVGWFEVGAAGQRTSGTARQLRFPRPGPLRFPVRFGHTSSEPIHLREDRSSKTGEPAPGMKVDMTDHPEFRVRRADHVGFAVASLDEALRFWVDGLGAQLVRTGEMGGEFLDQVTGAHGASVRMAIVSLADQVVELLEYRGPDRPAVPSRPFDPGFAHLALEVDDIDAVLSRIAAHGWRPQGSPQAIAAGARAGTRVIYAVGPDGATIEFMQPPQT